MGKKLRRVVLASTNDFHPSKNDKIKGWVEHNGGVFVTEITENVTHLVASTSAWKKYTPMVKQARKLRTIRIVSLDWLEATLLAPGTKLLETTKYEFEQRKLRPPTKRLKSGFGIATEDSKTEKRKRQYDSDTSCDTTSKGSDRNELAYHETCKKRKLNAAGKDFDNACKDFENEMNAVHYHPYSDSYGFVYQITLMRSDVLRNRLERHRLKVRYVLPSSLSGFLDDATRNNMCPLTFPNNQPKAFVNSFVPPTLASPLCPLPMHYLPEASSYSSYPIVLGSLPPNLHSTNPELHVRIYNPCALTLQLFESDGAIDVGPAPNSIDNNRSTNVGSEQVTRSDFNSQTPKRYACYTVYTRPGHRHVQVLAPPGSTWDFAWTMWKKFFEKRTGIGWDEFNDEQSETEDQKSPQQIRKMDDQYNAEYWRYVGSDFTRRSQKDQSSFGSAGPDDQAAPEVTVLVSEKATTCEVDFLHRA